MIYEDIAQDQTYGPTPYANTSPRWNTEHAVALLVIGAVVFLVLVKRGMRGVSVEGVGSVGFE